jgi:hypothetical protein
MISTLVLSSCYKEIDEFIPKYVIAPGDYSEALKQLQEDHKVYRIDAARATNIYLDNAHIVIQGGSFVYDNGEPVQGEIEILASEYYEAKDILKYDLPTVTTTGELLQSHGVFYIDAMQDGKSLKIREGRTLEFYVPDEGASSESALFNAIVDVETGESSWLQVSNDTSIRTASWQDSSGQEDVFGYIFNTSELSWINIDEFIDIQSRTELCITLPEGNIHSNTRVFLVYEDIASIQTLNVLGDEMNIFCSGQATLPMEYEVTILVIAHRGPEHYEAATQRIIIAPNLDIELIPNKVSKEELEDLVDNL